MGGNAEIFGHRATPITLQPKVAGILYKTLETINRKFEEYAGSPLWSELFKKKTFVSGSSFYLFSDDISLKDLAKVKNTFGDIDLMVDSAHCASLAKWFDYVFEAQPFGQIRFLGYRPSGNQYITLWHMPGLEANVQIDFEAVEFVNGEPSEWARFSHSSAWADMEHGIKGVAHKYIFRAMQAPNVFTFILEPRTARSKEKTITASPQAFSLKGLRTKYVPVNRTKDGLQVMRETTVEEAPYNTSVASICQHYFQSDNDLEKMWSFVGVVNLIKQHKTIEEQIKIVNGFIRILWGEGAQQIYRCQDNDRFEKMKMFYYLVDHLNVNENAVNNWRLISNIYYGNRS